MSLIDEVKKYDYIGMPFHAEGFPQPVYSYLIGSNDGVNWDNLKSYNFGWRDTSLALINDEYFTCTGTYVNYTKDFETFKQITCPNMGLKNLWASEFYKDNDDKWWFVYCGSETDVDYSEYKMYASRFYPDEHKIDSTRYDITLNEDVGTIDPNINYINGYYYLWCSITSTSTQELRLYRSRSILGVYSRVDTNIVNLTRSIGYTWNEAPEMIVVGNKYYLYSDPWNKGDSESARNMYRCESTDLINWSNMTRLTNASGVTYRHFTPLYQDIDESGDEIVALENINLEMWDGDPNTYYSNNLNNFRKISNFISNWNNMDSDYFETITQVLDVSNYQETNRNSYQQFLNNAKKINTLLDDFIDKYRVTDYDYVYQTTDIPKDTDFNRIDINAYWQAINAHFAFLVGQVNDYLG